MRHIATFRGHVQEVYQIAWASDSRLFVSGSKDSTMKVWDAKTGLLVEDLPGHADEVFYYLFSSLSHILIIIS